MSRNRLILIAAAAAILALLLWWRSSGSSAPADAAHGGKGRNGAALAVAVELTQARLASAPVELTAMGTVISPHSVNVRAQVGGTLAEVYFTEGDNVAAGQKLALIDAAPYQASVNQARAQLARDRATLDSARSQFERMKPLADKDYVTPQEYENARAAFDEAQALLQADQAALANAQINLDRTLVRAPIAGRTGSLNAKPGNVISTGDTLPLVVINQLQPVQVEFSVPQSALASVQGALAKGPVLVRITNEQGSQGLVPIAEGKLVFVDNAVDAATGTVRLRAESDNQNEALWPGAFVGVAVRLSLEPNAVLLPESAVQAGAAGNFVFLVAADNSVAVHSVNVGRQVGRDLVVSAGLKGGETVVAKAPRNLGPGMHIKDAAAATPASADTGEHKAGGKKKDP